jgi:kynureninase
MVTKSLPHPSSFTDDLSNFRQRFVISEPRLIYLDGNSLGRLPMSTAARLREVVRSNGAGS